VPTLLQTGSRSSSLDSLLAIRDVHKFTLINTALEGPDFLIWKDRLASGTTIPVDRLVLGMCRLPADFDYLANSPRNDYRWQCVYGLFTPRSVLFRPYPLIQTSCHQFAYVELHVVPLPSWSSVRHIEFKDCTTIEYLAACDFIRETGDVRDLTKLDITYDVSTYIGHLEPHQGHSLASLVLDDITCSGLAMDLLEIGSRVEQVTIRVPSIVLKDEFEAYLGDELKVHAEAERQRRLAKIKVEVA
jgi:hypothetical protein